MNHSLINPNHPPSKMKALEILHLIGRYFGLKALVLNADTRAIN